MELLYFICGILSVGITYAVVLLKKNQSNYHDALARLQHHQNISSIRSGDMKEKIKYVEDTMIDIQSNMEKDQYKNLSKINERLKVLDELANANSTRISESNTVNTKTMTDAFNEIQQIKNNLKALGEDPNFLNRY
tara:strand:+ start:57 stop:464 length:408 start_codon:yes stop_codon:yes gene_type:complete